MELFYENETDTTPQEKIDSANLAPSQIEMEALFGDYEVINGLASEPPAIILIHGYGFTSQGEPNAESRYVTRAVEELVLHLKTIAEKNGEEYVPHILVDGGIPYHSISDDVASLGKYAIYTQNLFGDKNVQATVWSEATFAEYISLHSPLHSKGPFKPAVDTRGEIMFADGFRHFAAGSILPNELNPLMISICRLGHENRIKALARANNVEMQTLTAEGILSYTRKMSVIERFLRMYPEYLESERSFSKAESRKMWLLKVDPTGERLEQFIRLIGDKKKYLFKLAGQKSVEN